MKTYQGYQCPVEASLQLIGGKYKALIIWFLTGRTLRYNEIRKSLSNVTDKMLSRQLRELERDGLIHREVYPVVPPRTEYSLTDLGKSLSPILIQLCHWGETHLIDPESPKLA
jgi:Predicted transcriptional regulators